MRRCLFSLLCAMLAGCATIDLAPTPNSCAVWSRAASAKLTQADVWNRVLAIQFTAGIGHEVCVFEHSDQHIWCYDPALDNGQGNFGGSYRVGIDSRSPLFLAAQVARNAGRKVKAAHFLGEL